MATNPMQRKARNSFLLGMLLMLIITGAIIAFLMMQLMNMKKAEEELEASYVTVYTLNRNVDSGEEVTQADFTMTQVVNSTAPTDYLTDADLGTNMTAKIAMTTGTVLSKEMINIDDDETGNDVRKQEYNMFVLPMDLKTGDYIDIRLLMPSGTDYIVISKKKVEIPIISGMDSPDTITMELSEDEISTLSGAIVDAFRVTGAKLYVNKYTEPGLQEAATPTYPVSREVLELINANPNIVEEARNALWSRYNTDQRNNNITPAVEGEEGDGNYESKIQESITNSLNTRQEYLEGLSAAAAATTAQ